MRRAAIYNSLLRYFVEQKVFEDSVLEFLEETEVGSKFNKQLAMRKLEIEEIQIEKSMEIVLELKRWKWKKDRRIGNLQKDRKITS